MPDDKVELPTIGVDVGGTGIKAALVERDGTAYQIVTRKTDPSRGAEAVIADVVDVIEELRLLATGGTVRGVGVGIAGQVSEGTGVVSRAPNLGWSDLPLRERLEAATALPVHVINDVQAATYAEWLFGAGKGVQNLACILVGTGVGGGVVIDGHLFTGATGSAGEFGHTVVMLDGPPCSCGGRGCLEALVSGWAIGLRARRAVRAGAAVGGALLELAGGDVDRIDAALVARAGREGGDLLARRLIDEAGRALAAGVISIVNALNPSRVILGGGVIEGIPGLVEQVKAGVAARALPAASRSLDISTTHLGWKAGLVGAAARSRQVGNHR